MAQSGKLRLEPLLIKPAMPAIKRKKSLKSNSLIDEIDLYEIEEEKDGMRVDLPVRQAHQQLSIKSKFARMIELHNKSLTERHELQKQRIAILKEEEARIRFQANRVKYERSQSGVTTRSWKVKNMQKGAIVRSNKLQNEYLLAKREIQELKDKKSIVNDLHKTMSLLHGKYADRAEVNRNQLKVYQEYKCGLISQITQIKVVPRSIHKETAQPNPICFSPLHL